ncbi:sigma-70 family RNA polymerase sigma factor [Candidatus Electronema sp. PJ]|uniref:sigma-70 family RNA polymerase sigma factor n=1 Tax=Candidatus Electronema sp. PJ TaxID=3401572 RepID=UPI003AA890F7
MSEQIEHSIEEAEETEAQPYYPVALVSSDEENLPAISNPALHRYLQEISQYELLSREETDELAVRFRETGDPEAAYRLVSANLRLVVKVAMDFQKYWMQNFMDLVQEGNVGLVQATKKFDPYRGVKFSYYAAYWIRAYILKFIMDNWRLVKIGTTQTQRRLFYSLNKEKKLLEAQGFKPNVKLLAERLQVKESEIVEMGQRMDSWDVSLEAPLTNDSDDEQKDFFQASGPAVEDIVAMHEVRERIAGILSHVDELLNDKEKVILNTRLLSDEPETLQTIADQFEISRERVRQIEVNLLKKLRAIFEKELPDVRDFLDAEYIAAPTVGSDPH